MNDKRRPIIGVVTAIANGVEQKQVIKGIVAKAIEYGYDTAVISNIYNSCFDNNELVSEQKIYDLARSEDIDGIIVISESFSTAALRKKVAAILSERKIPTVVVGAMLPEFNDPDLVNINTDDITDMETVTSHMMDVHGYRDIDIITGQPGNDVAEKRAEGYRIAMRKHGIEPDPRKIHYGDFWLESGKKLAKDYVSGLIPMPEAVVAANDYMACGLLEEFSKLDVKVPEQIAIASYEHSGRRMYHYPLLTTYKRNREELGIDAVIMLKCLFDGEPVPELSVPTGELIPGDTCGCGKDEKIYREELKYVAEQRDYSDWNLFSTMEQGLIGSRSLQESIDIIGENQWLIRYVDDAFLCLYSNWYESELIDTDQMSCRSIMPWLDTTPFEVNKYEFSKIFKRDEKPSVMYFTPIYVGERHLGHMILRYRRPDGYDDVFRNWLKSITNGLEFLRMKNDIQYLSSCQDLSEFRDTLTGMYNAKGMKRAYSSALGKEKGKLFFMLLRIGLFEDNVFSSENSQRIEAIQSAAKAVEQFCGNHDIAGHINENTFVCLAQSSGNEELLTDTLSSILIQHKTYMSHSGMDSFICICEACEGQEYDAILSSCQEKLEKKRIEMAEKRSQIHYKEVIELRNTVYSSPEFTFDTEGMFDNYFGNPNHLRMLYKKCFGISFHQDCIASRIAKARYYLATTSMSMADVAEKCGYLDNKYFLRQFSSASGITAGQYRNIIKR
ncbi:MAG: substrate-binding domain-containing protein [Ruminococcus sp.]|nr:substrate-binding domain-containing protein [Ruminococcus sp.]